VQSNLGNLLRVRARLVERLYGIHKLHANYGRVFSEWSAKEKEMGDGLQVFISVSVLVISFPTIYLLF
jgi:sorting nexin-4